MKLKEELIQLRNRVKEEFLAKVSSDSKEKNDDNSDYYHLNTAIDQLIQKNMELEEEILSRTKEVDASSFDLNDKVDAFIDWYHKNVVKEQFEFSYIGEYYQPIRMRDLIEKMAVWYELRYPSYEVNRILPGSGQEGKHIDHIMFELNPYIQELFEEDSLVKELEWNKFYQPRSFFLSLPEKERRFFQKKRYAPIVSLYPRWKSHWHFHVTQNGIVDGAEEIDQYTNHKIKEKDVVGKSLTKVYQLFLERGVEVPKGGEFLREIESQKKWDYQREELLNCVMYRIIERGGNRIGPRRAFLFAKEFHRNIDIPMMYGIDYSDPGLKDFIHTYLKEGGNKSLKCYVDYFTERIDKKMSPMVTLEEILLREKNMHTDEEKEYYQRLTNILASSIDEKALRRAKVQQFRMKRKILQKVMEREENN